jgi:hypothetical protein
LELAQNEEPCLLGAGRVLGKIVDLDEIAENYLPAALGSLLPKCACPHTDKTAIIACISAARRSHGLVDAGAGDVRYDFMVVEGAVSLSLRR